MNFKLEIERHPDTNQVIAVYLRLREGEVARTIELCEDGCYVDEDASGHALGVEMLAPGGKLILHFKDIEGRYTKTQPDIELLLEEVREAMKSECLV